MPSGRVESNSKAMFGARVRARRSVRVEAGPAISSCFAGAGGVSRPGARESAQRADLDSGPSGRPWRVGRVTCPVTELQGVDLRGCRMSRPDDSGDRLSDVVGHAVERQSMRAYPSVEHRVRRPTVLRDRVGHAAEVDDPTASHRAIGGAMSVTSDEEIRFRRVEHREENLVSGGRGDASPVVRPWRSVDAHEAGAVGQRLVEVVWNGIEPLEPSASVEHGGRPREGRLYLLEERLEGRVVVDIGESGKRAVTRQHIAVGVAPARTASAAAPPRFQASRPDPARSPQGHRTPTTPRHRVRVHGRGPHRGRRDCRARQTATPPAQRQNGRSGALTPSQSSIPDLPRPGARHAPAGFGPTHGHRSMRTPVPERQQSVTPPPRSRCR